MHHYHTIIATLATFGMLSLAACGEDDSDDQNGSTGGSSGSAGQASGGTAGEGTGGTGGTGGSAGSGNTGGSGGSSGTAGSGGSSGSAGTGGGGAGGATGCIIDTPVESFESTDAPTNVGVGSYTMQTPWGYDKQENAARLYPLVVHGCWGEGNLVPSDVKTQYPSFYMEYQECNSDSDGSALSGLIDTAIQDQGMRIDTDRVYLTGFSKGGSGSYKLVRGFLSEGKLFAGIIRVAGQSETELPDEAVEKTSIWYHIGLDDTPTRVQVAEDAYQYVLNHPLNASAVESTTTDTITGHDRTTKTLTKDGIEIMKKSEYVGVGHTPGPAYQDPALFDWLFAQSVACR